MHMYITTMKKNPKTHILVTLTKTKKHSKIQE